MPYLQLEVTRTYPTATKQHLSREMGRIYATIMHADIKRVTISIRELGEGGVWRCSEGEPSIAAILMCDVREGRTKDIREELAKKLIEVCNQILELEVNQLNVEFTQHSGDEMYHQWMGGFSENWSPDEI